MIPYTLMRAKINNDSLNILDASIYHIQVRTNEKIHPPFPLQLTFYINFEYQSINIEDYEIVEIKHEDFYDIYHIEIDDENYRALFKIFMEDYYQYLNLKLLDQQELLVNEDIKEECFQSYDEMMTDIFSDLPIDKDYVEEIQKFPLGLSIDHPNLYQDYLNMPFHLFKEHYFKQKHLFSHPLSQMACQYLYVGNSFCEHLLFDSQALQSMIIKAKKDHLKLVFVFPLMKEHLVTAFQQLLDILPNQSEIVVNDYGLLELAKTYPLKITLGILMNKHLKDPRLAYKKGNLNFIKETGINTDFYWEHIKNIEAMSVESSLYALKLTKLHDLYMPMYLTNIASYCPMAAMHLYHDRGKQKEIKKCPQFCLNHYFLYPKHLKMIGKYNGLFGYDRSILYDVYYLKTYTQKLRRLVIQ